MTGWKRVDAEELRRQLHASAQQGFTIDKDHELPIYGAASVEPVRSVTKDVPARKKK